MANTPKAPSNANNITPLDVIFSCNVCGATVSELYDNAETVQGLSDGINPKERLVTKLWLTSCCHVVCSRHLQGGAPAFHPQGTRPRAVCPVCVSEKNETKERELYSLRGFREGEYDGAIPACWFVTPPIKLDSSGKEMEALRFQYVALVRHTTQIAASHCQTKVCLAQTQHDLNQLQKMVEEEHTKNMESKQEVERLRAQQVGLQRFKERMPAIEHYLRLLPKIAEQNEDMREQLESFGVSVPA